MNASPSELDMGGKARRPRCKQIQEYVLENSGLKASPPYIANFKNESGLYKRFFSEDDSLNRIWRAINRVARHLVDN